MPKISLRLSEEELFLVLEWAKAERRSVEREIIHRLFRDREERNENPVSIEVSKAFLEELKMVSAQTPGDPDRPVPVAPRPREFRKDIENTRPPKKEKFG